MDAKNTSQQLFVGSLTETCSPAAIESYLSLKLKGEFKIDKSKNKAKKKQGFAVISVSSKTDKDFLLNSCHMIGGQEKKFQVYKSEEELLRHATEVLKKRIYVKGFPLDVTEKEITEIFSRFGDIEMVFIKMNKKYFEGGFFGTAMVKSYVTYKNECSSKRCLEEQPIFYKGAQLELYQKSTTDEKNDKKFVVVQNSNVQMGINSYGKGNKNDDSSRMKRTQKKKKKRKKMKKKKKGGKIETGLNHPDLSFEKKKIWMKNSSLKIVDKSQKRLTKKQEGYYRNSHQLNFKRKEESERIIEKRKIHKRKISGYIIEPFVKLESDDYQVLIDLFGFPEEEKFSMMKLVPVSRSTRRSQVAQFRNDINELVEDNEGYEHFGDNIRMNFVDES